MAEAVIDVLQTATEAQRAGSGAPDVGALLRLAQDLADQLLDLRGPAQTIRLARGMALNVVDVLEALQDSSRAARRAP